MDRSPFGSLMKKTKDGVFAYFKAAILTSLINIIVLMVGFNKLDIPLYGLVAVLIGLVDLMPVLGTGTILIPWSIIVLFTGNFKLAGSLILLYLITLLVDQIVLPIVLGKKIGLKPLYTLIITGISMAIWGWAGAIIGALISIVVSVFTDMKNSGALNVYNLYKVSSDEEFEDKYKDFFDDDLIDL